MGYVVGLGTCACTWLGVEVPGCNLPEAKLW